MLRRAPRFWLRLSLLLLALPFAAARGQYPREGMDATGLPESFRQARSAGFR